MHNFHGRAKGRDMVRNLAMCLTMASALGVLLSPGIAMAQALGPLFGIDNEVETNDTRVKLLPDDFFSSFPTSAAQNIAVEADEMVLDVDANQIAAQGNVQLSFNGYLASADRAIYDRETGDLTLIGNAVVRDPEQVIYTGERMEVTGDFKQAFVRALEMQTADGALITADEADYRNEVEAILQNGTYAPCGFCIDEHGHKIGWRIKTTKVVLNQETQTLYLETPELELLGYSVAQVPFLWLPDPTNSRAAGFRFPKFDYSEDFGGRIAVPYFHPVGPDTDLWLTPMLMSRQVFMLDTELTHRFDLGSTKVRAAGLYQFDKSAFAGKNGDRDWRGAIQSSGAFTPVEEWRAGWSYLTFTDTAFIGNYKLSGFDSINDIYVQHLSQSTFFDARVQEFVVLGETTPTSQQMAGRTVPLVRIDHVQELENDLGQVAIEGDFIGVSRDLDHGTPPFIYGYQGTKYHGSIEALWSKQMIAPGGLVVTPYAGLRLDAASYDGASPQLPVASSLFSATPIAALDVRFPMIGSGGVSTHLIEPIAQLVYRASATTLPGITNDNAQGLLFEDANLFSFNRFSGSDRQETGLRLNVGGQYLANFADESWLRFVGGQSFQLAGVNNFSIFDHGQTGNSSGLETTNSYLVAGLQGSFRSIANVGAKIEYDVANSAVARAAVAVEAELSGYTLSADYFFKAAQPARFVLTDTHTVRAAVGIPIFEYWTIDVAGKANIIAMDWTSASIAATYDDNYLTYGAEYTAKNNISTSAIDHAFTVNFGLKGIGGF